MRPSARDLEKKSSMTKGDASVPEENDFINKEGEEEVKVANSTLVAFI